MSSASQALRTSTWGTLRHPQFKALSIGGSIYFVGNAMQTMAASWMMAQISNSSFLVALVQTAVFLPMFLLALPAGVWADIADRRRLILNSLHVQVAAGVLLSVLMLLHIGGPGTLLFMIFVIGCCVALLSPAWNSAVSQSVPRNELPQAITVVSIAYNAARALGPTLAGLVFALGGAWNFFIAVLSTLYMAWAVRSHPPKPHPPTRLPPERLWGGMVSALRFARHSHNVLAQLLRTIAYSAAGSALWALLPSIGKQQLDLGASGFGLLMGCLGGGAVTIGFFIGRLRSRHGLEGIVQTGCVIYASAMLVTAWSPWDWPLYPALMLAGAAWMAPMSTFNTATQTSVPPWVRARAAALHTVCALGSFAIGSALWGALADLLTLPVALTLAAVGMLAGLLLAKPFPLRMGEAEEVTQAEAWEKIFITNEPAPDKGPIAVEHVYRIDPGQAQAFIDALSEMRAIRRRDGASLWRVYSDLADPTRYVERFIVESWADYLHQQARMTLADQEVEAKVKAFQAEGVPVITQHFLAES
ncbi:MAG: hypothetical protein RLZZ126_1957 [Pseudomonadota bacterium]|jgi:MFS family permease/quinol monooxygenase YgiN